MLGNLMKKTENADLKRRFGEFFSREGKELYREMLDKQVIFVDLLVAFPLLKPPVSVLAYLKRQKYLFAIKNDLPLLRRNYKSFSIIIEILNFNIIFIFF